MTKEELKEKMAEENQNIKRIFVFNKKGDLRIEAENFGNVWVVSPYDNTSILEEAAEFHQEEFGEFLEKCRRYYPVLNFVYNY